MKKLAILALALIVPFIFSCGKKRHAGPPRPVQTVGVEPIRAVTLEQETYNLPLWLKDGASDRTLIRFSTYEGLTPIPDGQIKALENLADKEDFNAVAAAGDIFGAGRLYTPDSIVYLAHRLGVIKEVCWVAPHLSSLTDKDLEGFKAYLKDKFPDDTGETEKLALNGKVIEGKINGVPVRVVALPDVPKIEGTTLVDIDATFFADVYVDEEKTRLLSIVSGMYSFLKDAGVKSDCVTLSASNEDLRSPLRFRCVISYLTSMFQDPKLIDGDPPAPWLRRAKAWEAEQKDRKASVEVYKALAQQQPDDAASRFDLANVYFALGDMKACREALADAARLDRGYMTGYREFAALLNKEGKKEEAKAFIDAMAGKK